MRWTKESGPGLYEQGGFDELIRAEVQKVIAHQSPEFREAAQRALDTPGADGARRCHELLQASGLWGRRADDLAGHHAGRVQ